MILKRFYHKRLAQASFLVGCPGSGEAIVVDPNRNFEPYLRAAAEEKVEIVAVTETHIHADYLSGSRELAQITGARLYLSAEGGPDWQYAFAKAEGAQLLRHGDSITVGAVRLDVVHTPGHTPEHICFILTDEATSPEPLGVFTGDFIFVGDVGRPDLLERAAKIAGTMEAGARQLFTSLRAFKERAPHLILWPGHGSGSACGKALGGVPVTTLAYEKLANWALRETEEDGFVREVLEGQPDPPAYFKEMKRLNREGPPLLGGFPAPERIAGARVDKIVADDTVILDIRPAEVAAGGMLPGSFNVPLNHAFLRWAGGVVPFDSQICLVAGTQEEADEAARELAMIGYDHAALWCGRDAVNQYQESHHRLPQIELLRMEDAAAEADRGDLLIVDVRTQGEFLEGHIPGAIHHPLATLSETADDIPKGRRLGVHCATGNRAAIGASVLLRLGFCDVVNITDGFEAYEKTERPIERGEPVLSR